MPSTAAVTSGYTTSDAVSETPEHEERRPTRNRRPAVTSDAVSEIPEHEERRPTRNRRPPQFYGNYVTH